ncbi:PREDICTED: probable protein phosphatase 2C 71 isoform X2 [Ipomoea nil]|uniref:probable protein phosphatase 2C 71 isoform X2 n=1 Tax=Ipomoea nil TaxID=35883 RepID=UPI000901E316|nr:PREDICTED: probable protein phosphatase 2C 71 isoform X2 [Ipomoea nil]
MTICPLRGKSPSLTIICCTASTNPIHEDLSREYQCILKNNISCASRLHPMADLLSNSIPKFPLFNPAYTPPKLLHPFSALSRTSIAGRWSRRRRRKPPQIIFFCKPSSQDLAVISTHEHGDGSLIFRFGDPSELAKEEESKPEKVGSEDVEEFSVVKVLDGDCEREVIVKNVERKVRADATVTKISDSVVIRSEGSSLLERGIESVDEQLLEISDDCFASSVHQTGLLDEIVVEKDGGRVSIELIDTMEVQAEQSDRELSEKSASEVCTTNVVDLEKKDWGEASIPLTDNVEAQAEEFDTENVVALENDGGKESIPLIDNVEVQAEQGDRESSEKLLEDSVAEVQDSSGSEITEENAIPKDGKFSEEHEAESSVSLRDNGGESTIQSISSDVDSSMTVTVNYVNQESSDIQTAKLVLSSGAALLPHPSKALTGGEDAYFVTNQNWLGIADGVVQWSLEGIYPGLYSRELMENCEKVILQSGSDSGTDPKVVLKLSVAKVESPGSSTALIAHFDGQAFHVANIGDSGFMIIRNGVIYKKSSPMLHEFNFPMQIESGDDPSQVVEEYRIELDEGDIVVTGTDGLFDNLYAQEIASIITKLLEANETPKEIAEILATRAQEVGGATSGRTPFSDAAQAAGYVGQTGGKLDDVAVIVSLVQDPTH